MLLIKLEFAAANELAAEALSHIADRAATAEEASLTFAELVAANAEASLALSQVTDRAVIFDRALEPSATAVLA